MSEKHIIDLDLSPEIKVDIIQNKVEFKYISETLIKKMSKLFDDSFYKKNAKNVKKKLIYLNILNIALIVKVFYVEMKKMIFIEKEVFMK